MSELVTDRIKSLAERLRLHHVSTSSEELVGRAENDNSFVEQKNWPVVRQAVGYHRYDSPAELRVLDELYTHLRLYVNFFQPSQKLVEKTRTGAKVYRRHDRAQTPYRRVMASAEVSRKAKTSLTHTYMTLSPAQLQRDIIRCQRRLLELVSKKHKRKGKEVAKPADHPWRGFEFGKRAATTPGEASRAWRGYAGTGESSPSSPKPKPRPSPKTGRRTRAPSVRQRKAPSPT